jgi:glycosyltransferase involved in cell wall biosynthesis
LLGFLGVDNPSAVRKENIEEWVQEGIIEYLGSSDDIRPFIAKSDCVVLPSYREGTPRALLESAAMGKPLIATDVPGCKNVVDDGVNGYLCESHSSKDLAEKMEKFVLLSMTEKEDMGKAGRLKMEREYDESIVIGKYLKIINEELSSRQQ